MPSPEVHMSPASDDHAARGAESLSEVLRRLDDDGYTGQFQTRSDSMIRCLSCDSAFSAANLPTGHGSARLEGASDPSDMSLVVPLECPECRAHGTLVLRYGPEASAEE